MAKKRVAVDNALQSIIDGGSRKNKQDSSEEKTKPVATRLEIADADRLDFVAKEMGINNAAVIRLAVLKFLKAWDDGERPKKTKKTIEIWDV